VLFRSKLVKRLCDKIRTNRDSIVQVKKLLLDDAKVCVIAYGSVARSAIAAVARARERGIKAGFLGLTTIWPFPDKEIEAIADHVDRIIVAEMNYGQIVREVERRFDYRKITFVPKLGEDPHTPDELLSLIMREKK